jgi:hypothetical protein
VGPVVAPPGALALEAVVAGRVEGHANSGGAIRQRPAGSRQENEERLARWPGTWWLPIAATLELPPFANLGALSTKSVLNRHKFAQGRTRAVPAAALLLPEQFNRCAASGRPTDT